MDERSRPADDLDAYIATYSDRELKELAAAELALDIAIGTGTTDDDLQRTMLEDSLVQRNLQAFGYDLDKA